MERLIRYNFLIDLESIQHRLSSDYSLNRCFSRRFPYIDGPSFSLYKLLQNIHFSKVGKMHCFQELYVLPTLMVHHFLCTNPYKISIFQRSVTCIFFRNRTHVLTRTQRKVFEDMFLVKIANKGTSVRLTKMSVTVDEDSSHEYTKYSFNMSAYKRDTTASFNVQF